MRRKTFVGLMMVLGLLFGLTGGGALGQGIGPQGAAGPQFAVGTDFTYQGRVLDNGTPINSTCDFEFKLYDDNVLSPTQVDGPVQQTNVPVSDGYFSASVDFGSDAFTGEGRQLEIGVRCPAGSGSYTTLTGMIPISAAPYAHSLRPGASVQSTGTALNLSSSSTSGSALHVTVSAGSGDAAAVFGSSSSSAGAGISGYNTAGGYGVYGSAGSGYGVYGRSGIVSGKLAITGVGVWGDSGNGMGVYGTSNNAAGIFGLSTSNVGVGGASTSGSGVQGSSNSGTGIYGTAPTTGTAGIATGGGTTYGVYGRSTSVAGHGVFGTSPSTDYQVAGVTGSNTGGGAGAGVYGYSLGGYGVHGRATSGTGVYGTGSTTGTVGLATGDGTTYGVYGRATSLSGRGLYGEGGFYGLYAVGADSTGLSYGAFAKTDTTGPGYGVRAEANNTENGYGGYFEATDHVGVYAKGEDGGSRTVGDVELGGSWGVIAAQETWNSSMSLVSNDDVVVYLDNNDDDDSSCFSVYDPGDSPIVPIWEVCHTEPAASSIKTDDHGTQKLYASESPEPWVEDFGTATLVEGSTTVVIEPIYAQTVNLDDYHVFLTPLGDCNGLFVEAKGPTSFDVGELAGGTSNVSFDYRIVARRSGSDSAAAQEVSP